MKLKMAENSLFAILLRAQWWVSVLVAVGSFGALRLLVPDLYAFFGSLPFVVIAVVAAWKQLRAPSASRIAAGLEALRAMAWEEFARALEEGFRREGYAVQRLEGGAADFELAKAGRMSLVCARRWKAAVTGVEPLKELAAAGQSRGAGECVYVCAGEMTGKAKAYALEKRIRRLEGAELAMLARAPRTRGSR
jgi:restriction system protein